MISLTEITQEQISAAKVSFRDAYSRNVESLGYELMVGTNSIIFGLGLIARLHPKKGSPDPIPDNLLAKIRDEVLPKIYGGIPVYVEYMPMFRPLK